MSADIDEHLKNADLAEMCECLLPEKYKSQLGRDCHKYLLTGVSGRMQTPYAPFQLAAGAWLYDLTSGGQFVGDDHDCAQDILNAANWAAQEYEKEFGTRRVIPFSAVPA